MHVPLRKDGWKACLSRSVVLFVFALFFRVTAVLIFEDVHPFFGYHYGVNDTHAPTDDSHRYVEVAMNLNRGLGYPLIHETEPHAKDFRRGPFFTLFLASVFRVFGFSILAVGLIQALVSSITVVIVKNLALQYFEEGTAVVAAWAWCLLPASVIWPTVILRETWTTFLLLLALWMVGQYKKTGRFSSAAAVGVALGIGVLQDPLLQMVVVIVGVAIGLHTLNFGAIWTATAPGSFLRRVISALPSALRNRAYVRAALLKTAVFFFAYGATISPWLYYTYKEMGRPVLGTTAPYGFWDNQFNYYWFKSERKKNLDPTWDDYVKAATEHRFEVARHFLGPDAPLSPPDLSTKKLVVDSLMRDGTYASRLEIANLEYVFNAIREDPALYLGSPPGKMVVIKILDNWLNFMVQMNHAPNPIISNLSIFLNTGSILVRAVSLLSMATSMLLFAVFIRTMRRGHLLSIIWLSYWLFFFIVWFRTEPRYLLPVTPLAIMVVVHGCRDLWGRYRRRVVISSNR